MTDCIFVLSASGPATPDSSETASQHLSPEASRKTYWRTWDGSTGGHASPSVFSDHAVNASLGGFSHLKSPTPVRTRSVSDSSAPRRGRALNGRQDALIGLKQRLPSF